jgi:hypothetical protein
MGLPRRFGTEDIVFGPKLSFAVIGVEALANQEAARRAARQLSADATALDQRGCNSPHTVFVERGAAIGPAAFAEILADELHQGSRRRALPDCGVPEAFAVLGTRAEYDMRGLAWYSEDVRWSVFYAEEDRGMAEPRFCSSLFVRPVDNIFDVTQFCSIHTQTAGLAVGERRTPLADALTAQGVDRCTQLGQMTVYDNPWDGMYPIDRMVRWVSLK